MGLPDGVAGEEEALHRVSGGLQPVDDVAGAQVDHADLVECVGRGLAFLVQRRGQLPELVEGHDTTTPQSLTELPWLQELGTNEVADWLRYRGIVPDTPINVSQMPGNLIMSAVRRGNGLTYTARAFFQNDISAGRITVLFSEPLFGLYYVETRHDPVRPAVRLFVDWLLDNSEQVEA